MSGTLGDSSTLGQSYTPALGYSKGQTDYVQYLWASAKPPDT